MPVIKEFTAPENLGLQPTEIGVEATAGAARRVGAFSNQVSESTQRFGERGGQMIASDIRAAGQVAVDYEDHQQISHGAKTYSDLLLQKTQEWNDIAKNSDPNDPSIAKKFLETSLEPALEKWKDGFTTEKSQQWAEQHGDALRNHMFQKTTSDMSTLAGEAVKVNASKVINNSAATARLDPSSLDFQLKTVDSALKGVIESSPTLTPDMAAKVSGEVLQKAKEGIVKSAVIGMIERNPNIDLAAIEKKYGDYITGPEMQLFQKNAKAQAKANLLTDKQLTLYNKQQAENRVHEATNKNFADNVKIDPNTNRPIIDPRFFKNNLDIVRNNPDAPNAASTARTYIDWGEHQQNLKDEQPRTDPATKAELMSRMFDPDKPTTTVDILRAEADNKLNTHDGAVLRSLAGEMERSPIRGPLYQSAIEGAKERVGFGILADGHERFANAMQAFIPEYMKAMRDGTLKPNALDLRDESSLINQSIKRFEPDAQTRMMAHSLKNLGLSNLDKLGLPQPGTTPAPKPAAPVPALPPPDERKKGQIYPTARGQMKWTGVDWVKP